MSPASDPLDTDQPPVAISTSEPPAAEFTTALPFTTAQARAAGISPKRLRGRAFRQLLRGVHVSADTVDSFRIRALAAMLVAPFDAVLSHTTALRVFGLTVGDQDQIHVSTRSPSTSDHAWLTVHRRVAPISRRYVGDFVTTSPERAFVDSATQLSLMWLVVVGDWLVHQQLTTLDRLRDYVRARHLDGVKRARAAIEYVIEGAESPMESVIRLMLLFAELPHPAVNADIFDSGGNFLARGDLVLRKWKIVIEYDGEWHERSSAQRRRDRDRRERLEAAGWRVIVIVASDLASPAGIVGRVYAALCAAGYTGPSPVLSPTWHAWFADL